MAREIEHQVRAYAPKALTANAHMILRNMADSTGADHRVVEISIVTLATDARCDVSTVYAALRQLRELNIAVEVPEDQWPALARRQRSVVRRILPKSEWALAYDPETGRDIAPDQAIHQGEQDPVGFPHEPSVMHKELKTKELKTMVVETTSLLRIPRENPTESSDSELDPASTHGPYAVSAAPKKLGRTANPDSSMGLASYFRETLQGTEFGRKALLVPDAINYKILASVLGRWLKDGTPAHQIRIWMDAYAATGQRTPGVPVWKSFLASRALLARASVEAAELDTATKRMTDLDDPEVLAYWGVTAADVKPLTES